MLDFKDGRFFEFTLLSDGRFSTLTTVLTGLSSEQLASNDILECDVFVASPLERVFATAPLVPIVANLMAAWALFIEGPIAALFLWPPRKEPEGADACESMPMWLFWGKNGLLLTFIVTT